MQTMYVVNLHFDKSFVFVVVCVLLLTRFAFEIKQTLPWFVPLFDQPCFEKFVYMLSFEPTAAFPLVTNWLCSDYARENVSAVIRRSVDV